MSRPTPPINLNKRRKDRARAEKRVVSDANAVKFGRSKAEKTRDTQQVTQLSSFVDGHKRDE